VKGNSNVRHADIIVIDGRRDGGVFMATYLRDRFVAACFIERLSSNIHPYHLHTLATSKNKTARRIVVIVLLVIVTI
jgi:hypothetical protein